MKNELQGSMQFRRLYSSSDQKGGLATDMGP